MQHRGEILERVVRKKVSSISALARELDYDRTTVYRHFGEADLENGIIIKYAKALKYNFDYEFPDLYGYAVNMVNEPLTKYQPMSLSEALKERDHWRDKYLALLEKYTQVIETEAKK